MQQEAKVPHWDCTVETEDKCSKHFLKWRHRRRGRFSPAYQVALLVSVLDNKNFRKAKEQQLEYDCVDDHLELVWNIQTGTVLPHEYKGRQNSEICRWTCPGNDFRMMGYLLGGISIKGS